MQRLLHEGVKKPFSLVFGPIHQFSNKADQQHQSGNGVH